MIKTLSKLATEGNFNLIRKHLYQKTRNDEKLDPFLLRTRNKATCLFFPLLFNILLEAHMVYFSYKRVDLCLGFHGLRLSDPRDNLLT